MSTYTVPAAVVISSGTLDRAATAPAPQQGAELLLAMRRVVEQAPAHEQTPGEALTNLAAFVVASVLAEEPPAPDDIASTIAEVSARFWVQAVEEIPMLSWDVLDEGAPEIGLTPEVFLELL